MVDEVEKGGIKPSNWEIVKDKIDDIEYLDSPSGGRALLYSSQPYEAVLKIDGKKVVALLGFSDPYMFVGRDPPVMFEIEDWVNGRYGLHSFRTPEEVNEWFEKKGIDDWPDVQILYKRLVEFSNKIIQ